MSIKTFKKAKENKMCFRVVHFDNAHNHTLKYYNLPDSFDQFILFIDYMIDQAEFEVCFRYCDQAADDLRIDIPEYMMEKGNE